MTEEVRPRTLSLDVKDRMMVLEVLPQQSNLVDQLLSKDIREKVELSQSEMQEIGFKAEGTQLMWDDAKVVFIEVTFSEAEMNLISRMFKLASDESRVTRFMLDTILKFQKIIGV